jgi:hypothetical protein
MVDFLLQLKLRNAQVSRQHLTTALQFKFLVTPVSRVRAWDLYNLAMIQKHCSLALEETEMTACKATAANAQSFSPSVVTCHPHASSHKKKS